MPVPRSLLEAGAPDPDPQLVRTSYTDFKAGPAGGLRPPSARQYHAGTRGPASPAPRLVVPLQGSRSAERLDLMPHCPLVMIERANGGR
jgi:hypothetical protein